MGTVDSGVVYVMTYMKGIEDYYKIGCTSRDPEIRLKEVQRKERKHREDETITIELVGFVFADEMREAETKAQELAKTKLRLKKDESRRDSTDWFTDTRNLTGQQVLDVVGEACERLVYIKNPGNNYYSMKDSTTDSTMDSTTDSTMNVTGCARDFMTKTAKAIEKADNPKSGYVFAVTKKKVDRGPSYYGIHSTEGDPDKAMEKIKKDEKLAKIELVGFVYAKYMDYALHMAQEVLLELGQQGPAQEELNDQNVTETIN